MKQQKFMPYNQMNEVYQQEQFQQQDSQPLIEQVDPNYQPTDKQAKEYAIQVLGMRLPQDQRLLYLAKQGLKAPIPANWQPFQGRDGQVYYKHKITQEKTYQHPTDVQYRKKYQQQKQRMARKNLKSMSLKSNPLALGGLSGNPFGAIGSKLGAGISNISNLSSQSHSNMSRQISKLDPKLEQQLSQQVEQLQRKLKKQFKQFQAERQVQHDRNMKKYKQQFQRGLNQLKSDKSDVNYYQQIKQEKQKIKQRLKQAYQDRLKDQLIDVQKQQQKKFYNYQQLFQQDNQIKLKKYQNQRDNNFKEMLQKIANLQKNHQQFKQKKVKERQNILKNMKENLQSDQNTQIEQATLKTYESQLKAIKTANQTKINLFKQNLQHEYNQMRKALGKDPNQILQQMAQKKNRLKKMSQQKIQSMKKKSYQNVSLSASQELQKLIKQEKTSLEIAYERQIQTVKKQEQKRYELLKKKYTEQSSQKLSKKVQQIYNSCTINRSEYQKSMNKKILTIRDKFISEIIDKDNNKSQELNIKIKSKDKQQMIQNKQQLIASLSRQIQLERIVHKDLLINNQIVKTKDIDAQLKKLIKDLNIDYKPEIFIVHQKKFNELKKTYKADKQFLGSMMTQLQNTAIYPFYNKNSKNDLNGAGSSSSVLIKQYNKDVRTMRKNEQTLQKYQLLLQKAQLNDQNAIKQLSQQVFQYQTISVRQSLGIGGVGPKLREIQNIEEHNHMNRKVDLYGSNNSFTNAEDIFKQHSKFLGSVKDQLNRKLYKVRTNNFYKT